MYVDARDIVGRFLYYFGVWEPNLTAWLEGRLRPGDVFIDVGANIGYFSIVASKLVGDEGMVIAIEPEPSIYKTLQRNVQVNKLYNVRPVNAAAWDSEDTLRIFTRPDSPQGRTTVIPVVAEQCLLKECGQTIAMPLSRLVTQEEISRARVIKIDVEGAEWQVISGLTSLLHATRTDLEIVVEVSALVLTHNGKTLRDIFQIFGTCGFYPYWINNSYSAVSYFGQTVPFRPRRICEADSADSGDFVFSRTCVEVL